jgi:hypothetical protein
MLSVALLGFAGFAALCLAMEKHFNDLLGRKPTVDPAQGLRIGGWALLLLSLACWLCTCKAWPWAWWSGSPC